MCVCTGAKPNVPNVPNVPPINPMNPIMFKQFIYAMLLWLNAKYCVCVKLRFLLLFNLLQL